jgi:hypothetical protein
MRFGSSARQTGVCAVHLWFGAWQEESLSCVFILAHNKALEHL